MACPILRRCRSHTYDCAVPRRSGAAIGKFGPNARCRVSFQRDASVPSRPIEMIVFLHPMRHNGRER